MEGRYTAGLGERWDVGRREKGHLNLGGPNRKEGSSGFRGREFMALDVLPECCLPEGRWERSVPQLEMWLAAGRCLSSLHSLSKLDRYASVRSLPALAGSRGIRIRVIVATATNAQ